MFHPFAEKVSKPVPCGPGDLRGGSAVPVVSIKNQNGPVASITLDKDENVIGRDATCDIVLDDPQVSRRHATIVSDNGVYWIRDLGSTNGMTLNGVAVKDAQLRDGDMIRLGRHLAAFHHVDHANDGDDGDMTVHFYLPKPVRPVDRLFAAELTVVEHVNRIITSLKSIEEMIDFLFESMGTVVPCDRMSLAFIEEDGRRLRSYYTKTNYEGVLLKKGYAQDLTDSSLKAVIEKGRPRIIRDLEQHLADHPHSQSTRLIVEEGLRSSMTCPLVVDDRNVGVLFWSSRQIDAFDDHHIDLHETVVERLSQTLEKTYRLDQLQALNNAYFEVLGFVAHELKSPVSAMVQMAQTMADGYAGPVSDKQKTLLERMSLKGGYLLGLVKEYLNLAHIESGEMKLNVTRVGSFVRDVVDPALDIVGHSLEEAGMKLLRTTSGADHGSWDVELMKIVMVNLLGNAAKYGVEKGEIRLTVEAEAEELRVSVWNEGPGFPPDMQERLFRKFSRLPSRELMKRKGTGIGLYTTWKIVNQHGGHIRAASREGEWAEFAFRVPRVVPSAIEEARSESLRVAGH